MSSSVRSFFNIRPMAGNRRLFLLCLILFGLSALLSFAWFFPADIVQRRLINELSSQTGLQMVGDDASMVFPIGLQLDLYVESQVDAVADIEIDELRIRPYLSTLFSDAPSASLEGTLGGGTAAAVVSQKGLELLELSAVEVASLQTFRNDYRLKGVLDGRLRADALTGALQGQGEFSAGLRNAVVVGLEKIGLPTELPLGKVLISGKFNNKRFSIERMQSEEGALDLSGGGTLLVGDTPEQTRLNLNVRLHPNQSTPGGLRDLIQLTGVRPTTDGSYLLRVGGTLAKPVVR